MTMSKLQDMINKGTMTKTIETVYTEYTDKLVSFRYVEVGEGPEQCYRVEKVRQRYMELAHGDLIIVEDGLESIVYGEGSILDEIEFEGGIGRWWNNSDLADDERDEAVENDDWRTVDELDGDV
jgi:hypothetical protein